MSAVAAQITSLIAAGTPATVAAIVVTQAFIDGVQAALALVGRTIPAGQAVSADRTYSMTDVAIRQRRSRANRMARDVTSSVTPCHSEGPAPERDQETGNSTATQAKSGTAPEHDAVPADVTRHSDCHAAEVDDESIAATESQAHQAADPDSCGPASDVTGHEGHDLPHPPLRKSEFHSDTPPPPERQRRAGRGYVKVPVNDPFFLEIKAAYGSGWSKDDKPETRAAEDKKAAGALGKRLYEGAKPETILAMAKAVAEGQRKRTSKFRPSLRNWLMDTDFQARPPQPQIPGLQVGLARNTPKPVVAAEPVSDARWGRVLEGLKTDLGPEVVSSWFGTARLESASGGIIQISVDNRFTRSWILGHFDKQLLARLRAEFSNVERFELRARDGRIGSAPQHRPATDQDASAPLARAAFLGEVAA